MAPKPKKEVRKPTLAEQYETRRNFIVETAETPKDKKNLKKDLAKAKSDYVNAKKDKQSRAAGTAYNPAPMSAAAKKKAAAAGKATAAKVKNPMGLKQMNLDKRVIKASGTSKKVSDYKEVKPGSMATNTKITSGSSTKKASTKYSPAPMTDKQKKTAARSGQKTQAVIGIKKDLTKIAGVAGKVAGKVTSTAKKVAKAEVKAAKTAVGVAKKAIQYTPEGMAIKGAKAVIKGARGGMSIKEENKKLAETMRNIGKADKKK